MVVRCRCDLAWLQALSLRLPVIAQSDKLRANSGRMPVRPSLLETLRLASQRVEQYVGRLQQWALPRSRLLLLGLIGANLVVAVYLSLLNTPADELDGDIQLAKVENSQAPATTPKATDALPQPNVDATTELRNAEEQASREVAVADRTSPEVVEPQATSVSQAAASEINEAAIAHDERVCRVWGPEQQESAFGALVEQLDALGGFPEVRERTIQSTPDFLVYIDDLGSRDNAKRVASELASVKTDSYLIIAEDGRPILSVGVFSRRALADRQHARMQKLGYKVGLQTVERTQVVYNLTAHVPVDSPEYESSTSSCVEIAQGS